MCLLESFAPSPYFPTFLPGHTSFLPQEEEEKITLLWHQEGKSRENGALATKVEKTDATTATLNSD